MAESDIADPRILVVRVGSGRWCPECGALRNEADFSRTLEGMTHGIVRGEPAVLPCDACVEARRSAAL